jgi:dimethylargininase
MIVRDYYDVVERIEAPDTVDAGDIKMVGKHFYIGNSQRTTVSGAGQMISILEKYGMRGSIVPMSEMLHLKSGISYLENKTMVLSGEFIERPEFADFNRLIVEEDEAYAANCVWINGHVLVAAGFPKQQAQIESLGYKTIPLEMSEFQKVDGGLSCLSLRF